MQKGDKTKLTLLNELSSEHFISGQMLSNKMGISRAAISKHIKNLIELGLDIYSVTGKGYKLSKPLTLLDTNKICSHGLNPRSLEVLPVIDSTNAYLTRKLREGKDLSHGHAVVAECQTAGKGRRGRAWVSPFGSHLYLSVYFQSNEGLAAAAGLSLAAGIAVSDAIAGFVDTEVSLKWPNDLLIGDKKVAGILVEAEGQSDGLCHLVVGIGLNVDMPVQASESIDQPWTDLNSHAKGKIDRNDLCNALILSVNSIFEEYKVNRLENLYEKWNARNAYKNRKINLTGSKTVQAAFCRGIDQSGGLLIEDPITKKIERIHGGEISLRKTD